MPQPSPTFRSELAAQAIPLRSLARRLVGGELADDLTQDTLVVALSQPDPSLAVGGQLRGWLRAVLRNEHRGHLRRTRRRRAREQCSTDGEARITISDPALSQILIALREVVATLDEPYRGAIVARFLEERSAAEIARSEGCPAATVRWRVQEGLRQTRRRMDERFDGRTQWFGALVAFAELPPPPIATALSRGTPTMTKLALLKILTGVAAVAATATIVVAQTSDVVAEPAHVEAASVLASAKPSATTRVFDREHPAVIAAQAQTEARANAPTPDDAPPECDGQCEECNGEQPSDAPVPPWIEELTAAGPIGDPMDAARPLVLPGNGEQGAKVSIVACSEFDCPYCKQANATIERIQAEYGDKVAVHWLNMPLPSHPGAAPAAAAAIAAAAQGKFWEMHDLLFDRPGARDEDELIGLATELGLDRARFVADLRAEKTAETIADQQRTCIGNGAQGTPSFYINGDLLVGAQPYEKFAAIIDDELAP